MPTARRAIRSSSGSVLIRRFNIDAGASRERDRSDTDQEGPKMITPAYVRLMAQYNAEMNRRLYDAAAQLTDAERKADRGAFWKSIHGTLTHLLWGDTQWM